MKKMCFIFLMLLFIVNSFNYSQIPLLALETLPVYTVYTIEGEYLFERAGVQIGDEYIDKQFNEYVIIDVNEQDCTATAKYIKTHSYVAPISLIKPLNETKKIALYMTHNDESYITGDGYDSVYGKGGIHDVAKNIAKDFENKNVNVTLDETLHIPHDSNAYTRSGQTAKKLILYQTPDAIFDIHRDGISRGFYVTSTTDGEEHCMVRIVVGKSSQNFAVSKAFALSLMNTSNEVCPWLFVDLYVGSGHYNQGLHNKALLFEMGSHMVEKDLVLETTAHLVDVVYTNLYGKELTIPQNPSGTMDGLGDSTIDLGDTPAQPTNPQDIVNDTQPNNNNNEIPTVPPTNPQDTSQPNNNALNPNEIPIEQPTNPTPNDNTAELNIEEEPTNNTFPIIIAIVGAMLIIGVFIRTITKIKTK